MWTKERYSCSISQVGLLVEINGPSSGESPDTIPDCRRSNNEFTHLAAGCDHLICKQTLLAKGGRRLPLL